MKRIAAMLFATSIVAGAASAGTIHKRYENQQDRIAAGIASGSLSAREATRLETKEAALTSEVKDFRTLNGGTLTKGERVLVNTQQNALSRNIYRQKHDRNGR